MHITRLRISNILGVQDLNFAPGKFTEISGGNAEGKTTVIEALKSLFKGGEDATLLRKGEKKGEIVVVLDDGTEISRRVTEKTTTTNVVRDGRRSDRPMDVIKQITDVLSVNPIQFMRAKGKARVDVLLESMPIEIDEARVVAIAGDGITVPRGSNAFERIQAVRDSIFQDRTGTNRAIHEKESTINQLSQTLPTDENGEAVEESEDVGSLMQQLNAVDSEKSAELDRIATKLTTKRNENIEKVSTIRAESDTRIADAQKLIDELQKQISGEKDSLRQALSAAGEEFAKVSDRAAVARETAIAAFAAKRAPVADRITLINGRAEIAAKYDQTRTIIATQREELETLKADAARQTKSIDGLDAYKSELLAALPIPGLEVRDGEIYRDDVQFDRLNTAQQIDVAVEIAKLRAGELGIICVDGIEALDSIHYAAFKAKALASGAQLIVTKVGDNEFAIKTDG